MGTFCSPVCIFSVIAMMTSPVGRGISMTSPSSSSSGNVAPVASSRYRASENVPVLVFADGFLAALRTAGLPERRAVVATGGLSFRSGLGLGGLRRGGLGLRGLGGGLGLHRLGLRPPAARAHPDLRLRRGDTPPVTLRRHEHRSGERRGGKEGRSHRL